MKTKILTLIDPVEFDTLTTMQKRVAIAKDVLWRVNNEFIAPQQGNFFIAEEGNKDYINQNTCQCCAKGAIMCAFIGNFNKYSVLDYDFDLVGSYPRELLDVFSIEMFEAIESAFEVLNDSYGSWNTTKNSVRDSLNDTFYSYSGILDRSVNATQRLILIMQNIIDNHGKIVCKDGTVIE